MDAATSDDPDQRLAAVAAAMAEPARVRMLCSLMDGHARTATELAAVADIGASTASAHLSRLKDQGLIDCVAQGKHRYFRLASHEVATALEALLVVAGVPRPEFKPNTPERLRLARTCYDHMAGTVAVRLHDQLLSRDWLVETGDDYQLSPRGEVELGRLGLDVAATRRLRRRFACRCLDWSERRPHVGGALGAALLKLALNQSWLEQDLDSRSLSLTTRGRRELGRQFGLQFDKGDR